MVTDLTKKPYLIDAIVGNSRILSSLGTNGRMYRLWWPHIDTPQHLDELRSGIRFRDGGTSWFDDSNEGWSHAGSYVPRTNIYDSQATHPENDLSIRTTTFAIPDEDLLVREYSFTNTGTVPQSFRFVQYSSIQAEERARAHTTQFEASSDALVHFHRTTYFAIGSDVPCTGYQAGKAWTNAQRGQLNGCRTEMREDGALEWAIGPIAPGDSVSLPVYIAFGSRLSSACETLSLAKTIGASELRRRTISYWHDFLAQAAACPVHHPETISLYERSLLVMKLMTDEDSGAVIAAPEADEAFSRCGGYAFCWGRDAAFITTAFDRSGLLHLSSRFYAWTLRAQGADGSWQQRHYHDGSLAPSWGLQIDEGASILWGMNQHYYALPESERPDFLQSVWRAIERGADYLVAFLDPSTGLPLPSHDLWEERIGEHSYSAAAVYAGLSAAADMAAILGERERASRWGTAAASVREALISQCWSEEHGSFLRGVKRQAKPHEFEEALANGEQTYKELDAKGYPIYTLAQDRVLDISLLGISVPFGVLSPEHPMMLRTAEAVQCALTVPRVGGLKRYENDAYIGGNPWILTTLWLAQYWLAAGKKERALPLLEWAIAHQTSGGLLPEQIDRETGQTAWIVPLTWSHAMFILTVHMLAECGEGLSQDLLRQPHGYGTI